MAQPVPTHKLILVGALLAATAAAEAQVLLRPEPPPQVTAANERWYASREPISFAGDLYYPAGPTVYFDGKIMVPTGTYGIVTLYADVTVEPYSLVLVPIGGALMQPYERRRAGSLAGTVGSRAPSFPVAPDSQLAPMSVQPPIGQPVPLTQGVVSDATNIRLSGAVRVLMAPSRPPSVQRLWIEFQGSRWIPSGRAIALEGSMLAKIGEYRGFPVYAVNPNQPTQIFLPSNPGLVAPYVREK